MYALAQDPAKTTDRDSIGEEPAKAPVEVPSTSPPRNPPASPVTTGPTLRFRLPRFSIAKPNDKPADQAFTVRSGQSLDTGTLGGLTTRYTTTAANEASGTTVSATVIPMVGLAGGNPVVSEGRLQLTQKFGDSLRFAAGVSQRQGKDPASSPQISSFVSGGWNGPSVLRVAGTSSDAGLMRPSVEGTFTSTSTPKGNLFSFQIRGTATVYSRPDVGDLRVGGICKSTSQTPFNCNPTVSFSPATSLTTSVRGWFLGLFKR